MRWSLDFALVGAVSSFLAIACVDSGFWVDGFNASRSLLGWPFPVAAAAVGGVTGAILGPLLRHLLAGRLGNSPVYRLLLLGMFAGFAWGALVGAVASFALDASGDWLYAMALSAAVAGVAGAVQFGWLWLPYALRSARGRSTLPLVVAACVFASGLGWFGILTFEAVGMRWTAWF